jgi:Predicted membrane protein
MKSRELIETVVQNLEFVGVFVLVIIILIVISLAAEHLIKLKINKVYEIKGIKKLTIMAMLSAMSSVLMSISIPLPFVPSFYKLDFSEIPILICSFVLGPVAGVIAEFCKVLINTLLNGTTTAFVGEFANFVIGCSFIIPASICYRLIKTKKGAIIGSGLGTLTMTVFGSAFNAWYLLPVFAKLYGMPLDSIVAMGTAINPAIINVETLVLFAVVPFNLLKGVLISIITILIYKRIRVILK